MEVHVWRRRRSNTVIVVIGRGEVDLSFGAACKSEKLIVESTAACHVALCCCSGYALNAVYVTQFWYGTVAERLSEAERDGDGISEGKEAMRSERLVCVGVRFLTSTPCSQTRESDTFYFSDE